MAAPTPARGPPDAAAMKSRIITHMNADHQLSLRLYLQRYSKVPPAGTVKATLEDITTEQMILTSWYGRHVVPLSPPMKTLLEARERLVSMHQDCLRELDLSDIVVDSYETPTNPLRWGLGALVVLIVLTFPFRASLRPESHSVISSIWSLGGLVPGLARLSYALAPSVLAFIFVAHAVEVVYLARTRLRKHWVQTFSSVWWLWIADCAIEGYGAISQFDDLVRRKEDAKGGKGKH